MALKGLSFASVQFMFPSERHFKSFGHMAEMIGREFAFGVIFLKSV